MSTTHRLRILNAAQVVTVVNNGERHLRGAAMNTVAVIENGGVVIGADGRILLVGPSAEVAERTKHDTFERDVDATGKCVLPGFVDAHTHPVWSGDRCHEFHMKLAGASYMEVAAMGGGIGFTTQHTRESTEDELLALFVQRAARMTAQGTTTMEGKSGYGLDTDTEMKMLRVLHRAKALVPMDISVTFCGAHAVPKGKTDEEATLCVIDEMLPEMARQTAAGRMAVDNIDVFCETGVFTAAQSRRILAAGKAQGLEVNFHGDELTPMGSGELAGELSALAVSHLEHLSDAGIVAMAVRPSFAVLLPVTAYVLRIEPPPARKIIDGNVPVALGSDYCPNAHSLSMPFTMNLACVMMRMTVNEALTAATINAAASLGLSADCGSLEVGKRGDVVLLAAPKWEHVVYQMIDPPIAEVFKLGKSVFKAGSVVPQ
jgi:imidazolonepropionase